MIRLLDGHIGRQEGVSLLGISLFTLCAFTFYSAIAYARGNTTFIWLPASILLAFGGMATALRWMRRYEAGDLAALYRMGLGKMGAGVALLLVSALLFSQAVALSTGFVGALHSYVYATAPYGVIVPWVIFPSAYLAWGGLERIARTAKCFGAFLAFVLLLMLLMPGNGYQVYRLLPLQYGEGAAGLALRILAGTVKSLPVLIFAACLSRAMQGTDNVRRVVRGGAWVAAALILLTQLAIGLTYTPEQLSELYMPLFRLNMALLKEGYLLRLDKMVIFIMLLGVLIGIAVCLYGAAYLSCRVLRAENIRPAILTGAVLLWTLCYAQYEHVQVYGWMAKAQVWVDTYGWCFLWAPLSAACGSAALRRRKKERGA